MWLETLEHSDVCMIAGLGLMIAVWLIWFTYEYCMDLLYFLDQFWRNQR